MTQPDQATGTRQILLTPGPLTTTSRVREAMNRDVSTWDTDYNDVVQDIRRQLVDLVGQADRDSAVLVQGSGTFGIEAALGTFVPRSGSVLVIDNGAYGRRMLTIAERIGLTAVSAHFPETAPADASSVTNLLNANPDITHVAAVHCETTSGMLNPLEELGEAISDRGVTFLVDAMSSLGGIPLSLDSLHADIVVSSANKCIQGVPGFAFVVARRRALEASEGQAPSLALDLHDQWQVMESQYGKWRFTSPTHTVLAFAEALAELHDEGGVSARHHRYCTNQALLVEGMESLGFVALLPREHQSPIITTFHNPSPPFDFDTFYQALKHRGFVIYPGKVTDADTFRIGNIGDIHPADIRRLLAAIEQVGRDAGFLPSHDARAQP